QALATRAATGGAAATGDRRVLQQLSRAQRFDRVAQSGGGGGADHSLCAGTRGESRPALYAGLSARGAGGARYDFSSAKLPAKQRVLIREHGKMAQPHPQSTRVVRC